MLPLTAPLRSAGQRAFFRSRALRELAALLRWHAANAPDLAHLAFYPEVTWGPVMRDEALLLHSLIRALRPATAVEIGFLRGRGALNFLSALDDEARLYSFDIDPACAEIARQRLGHDPRFVFRNRSQDQLTRDDIDGRLADFVFLDAAHDLALNQATFERLLDMMTAQALIAVHDTGTLPRHFSAPGHWTLRQRERWVGDEYEHQPEERAFVNWLRDAHPEFAQLHIHSRRAYRHGLTLVQRSGPLTRPRGASSQDG